MMTSKNNKREIEAAYAELRRLVCATTEDNYDAMMFCVTEKQHEIEKLKSKCDHLEPDFGERVKKAIEERKTEMERATAFLDDCVNTDYRNLIIRTYTTYRKAKDELDLYRGKSIRPTEEFKLDMLRNTVDSSYERFFGICKMLRVMLRFTYFGAHEMIRVINRKYTSTQILQEVYNDEPHIPDYLKKPE